MSGGEAVGVGSGMKMGCGGAMSIFMTKNLHNGAI